MSLITIKEASYMLKHLRQVKHVTLNPNNPGVVRVHIIPPKFSLNKDIPSIIILNGQDILPVNLSWTILLSVFIDEILPYENKEIYETDWNEIVDRTIRKMKIIYSDEKSETFKNDLWTIIDTLTNIAYGKEPEADIGLISISDYAPYMKAPHRMDLMISSMVSENKWNCNQKCIHCYAAGQRMSSVKEITTDEWKKIIDKCKKEGIPQLTFTGGEPTLRDDLVELVSYSQWFITRLNTNGVLLTKELCTQLYNASLDSVQVTLYSADPEKHNILVGADNWHKTVQGIKNALEAGLNVSINTPLCLLNRDYTETLRFAFDMGIKYVSCSGLILTGNATKEESRNTQLAEDELYDILKSAFDYCKDHKMEISFTSPGWLPENKLRSIGFTMVPSCGACLSNMAITPDGNVVPCQSWLFGDSLGNMLQDKWKNIWNSRRCKEIRNFSRKCEQKCYLKNIAQGENAI